MTEQAERTVGLLLGGAIGDAIGLPREGLSAARAERLFGRPPLRQQLLFGRGMTSDDTDHLCMAAQALLEAPEDPEAFARSLGWRLRWWLLGAPAGVGWATLRATLKLWSGWPPRRSGVSSAGNGPAMRALTLGACLGRERAKLAAYVKTSTRITHTDPKAEQGALVVALAAWEALRREPGKPLDAGAILQNLGAAIEDDDLRRALRLAAARLERSDTPEAYLQELGVSGAVSGYIGHTVPAALYCWLRWPGDFRKAVEGVVLLGGDTDTTGFLVGALAGASLKSSSIPEEWVSGLMAWPRSAAWLRSLGCRLSRVFHEKPQTAVGPVPLFWPGLLSRNALLAAAVGAHGLRRLLPDDHRLAAGLGFYALGAIFDIEMTLTGIAGSLEREGNPVMRFMMARFGPEAGLWLEKSVAGLFCGLIAACGAPEIKRRAEWIWKVPMTPWVRGWMKRGERSWIVYIPLYGTALFQYLAALSWTFVSR